MQGINRSSRRLRTKAAIAGFGFVLFAVGIAGSAGATAGPLNRGSAHITPLRGTQSAPSASNLIYHGGRVMANFETSYAIFWEPPTLQTGVAAYVSPTYNSLIQRYFGDVGGQSLYGANTQYYEKKGAQQRNIVNSSTLGGVYVDTSPYPASDCVDPLTPGNCISDAKIQAEVTKAMAVNGWTAGFNHAFFVFTAKGEGTCTQGVCSFAYFCAYHGYFGPANKPVIYANMPYTGTFLSGCGTPQTPNNDIDADSTINVTSHEQMEAVTDPRLNAWYDSSGQENGDKCAWNFGALDEDGGKANENWNGHYYILQMEWSNAISGCVQ